jgi:antitoxin (DNA-binding transcriptional repressor) of toxin-antitoxin stability system
MCFSKMVWHGSHIVLTCRGTGVEVIVPYLQVRQEFGTDRFWERIPAGMVLRGDGPRRPCREGVCTVPTCGRPIHARELCTGHYDESRGGYAKHGKREKILSEPEMQVGEVRVVEQPVEVKAAGRARKITPEVFREIRRLKRLGMSLRAIGKTVGVSHMAVSKVLKGLIGE